MSIQVIPLNLLTIAPENVRKTDVGPDDTLVASIRAQGLLQNLVVRPNVAVKGKNKGQPAGTYAVVAGGRRLQALNILAEEGHLPADFGVPCAIHLDDAVAVSLAENFARKAMAPLDELDAFTTLVDQGRTEDEVARQYGVQVLHVRQRLKLARVSPVIREAFRDRRLNLDTLKAYTLTDDHEAQEAVWAAGWGNDAYSVRTRLTERKLNADHRVVQFVGIEAYEAVGGKVLRDLFGVAPACIEDAGLIERLAREKLQAHADALKADGWAWIDPVSHIDWGFARHCERLIAAGPGLTEAEQDEAEALSLELESLDAENDETAARGDEIEARLAELDAKAAATAWSPEQMAKAGGWITIGYAGEIAAELGYVRLEPNTEDEGADDDGERAVRPFASHQPVRDEPAAPGHSWALVEDMSAHLTAGLQAELVERPDIAYLVLLHALALDLFYPCSQDRSVGIRMHQSRAEWHGATTKGCIAVERINGATGAWPCACRRRSATCGRIWWRPTMPPGPKSSRSASPRP
jgi:ParB family chromosome partitioning protein